jgi:hypothetical protein
MEKNGGTRRRAWLRHCTTSRKAAGSIPDGVTGIFHLLDPSGRTTALWSTQTLTQIVPGIFPGGKGDQYIGLTLQPSRADCLEIWEPQSPGTLEASTRIALPLYGRDWLCNGTTTEIFGVPTALMLRVYSG